MWEFGRKKNSPVIEDTAAKIDTTTALCDECICKSCKIKADTSKCTRCAVCDGKRPKYGTCYKN